jgi:hypothetical protein
LETRRINAMHLVYKIKPDSRGLDPATQQASVSERKGSLARTDVRALGGRLKGTAVRFNFFLQKA